MNKPITTTIAALLCVLSSHASAVEAANKGRVLWRDPCETVNAWRVGKHVDLTPEQRDAYMHDGSSSIHVECPREPGMRDKEWSGWYWLERNVRPFTIQAGDILTLWYLIDEMEPYYPSLYFVLIDEKGRRRDYSVAPVEPGQWHRLRVDLSRARGGKPFDDAFGKVVKLHIAYYYNWFRQFRTYHRWIDDIQIVRGSPAAVGAAPEPALIHVRKTTPSWPVVFVPYRKGMTIDGDLTDVADSAPHGRADSRQSIPTIFNTLIGWNGPDDFSSRFWTAWNEDGLYFAVRARDDSLKCEDLLEHDFRDSDHWRMYFDMGREALVTGDKTNDRTDYIYAAIPTSPEGVPLIRSVHFGGHKHQINDEGRLFDVGSIRMASARREKGWEMELFFPAKLMRGFRPEANRPFIFGSIWGDTDTSGRECELAWPRPDPNDASYYHNFANYGDMVLLGKNGAFGYRLTQAKVNRHEPWRLKLYGTAGDRADGTPVFDLTASIEDAGGDAVRKWTAPVRMGRTVQWYDVELGTTGLEGGTYRLILVLRCGKVVLSTPAVQVELAALSKGEFERKIQADLAGLKRSSAVLGQRISAIAGKGYQTAYLTSSREVIDLFLHALTHPLGDVRKKKYASALRQLGELKTIAREALSEAQRPDRHAGKWRAIPTEIYSDGTPPEIREGICWHHGRPIFMDGWIGYDTTRGSAARIRRLGFNCVQDDYVLARVIGRSPDEGALTDEDRSLWDRLYETTTRHSLYWPHAVVTIHVVPDWIKSHAKMNRCSGHFLPFCLEAEDTFRMIDTYFRCFLPTLADKPNILSLVLMNEQTYEAGCEDAKRLYREWLQSKYDTIAALNRLWGTDYGSFRQIPRTKAHRSTGARYDWVLFNRARLNDATRRIIDLARRHDPLKRPVHTKPMTHFWRNPTEVYDGVDREALSAMSDFTGYDGGQKAISLDYLRSLDEDKLLYNSEGHGGFGVDPRAVYRRVWENAVHGVGANTRWLWDWPWGGWAAKNEGYPLRQPMSMRACARASLDIQRLAPEIHAISRAPAQVAILDSFASRAFDFENYAGTVRELHDALHSCQTPIRFITEKQLRNGLHRKYRLIIAPAASYIEADLIKPLRQFVQAGGRLVLLGDCFHRDQYGRKIALPAELVRHRLTLSSATWTDKHARLQWLDALLRQADVHRPLRVENAKGELTYGIEVLWAVKDNQPLVFLASFRENPEPALLKLTRGGRQSSGRDLITNEPVGETLSLDPFGVRLLQVEP